MDRGAARVWFACLAILVIVCTDGSCGLNGLMCKSWRLMVQVAIAYHFLFSVQSLQPLNFESASCGFVGVGCLRMI